MATPSVNEGIERAQSLLREAHHAVALTGAGMSTASGIPDFRSPESGLWQQVDPFAVASLTAFKRRPQAFYDWIRPMAYEVWHATPNRAHVALARLDRMGIVKVTITQNIDGLDLRAGAQRVIEIHGNFRSATCIGCYKSYPGTEILDHLINREGVPECKACGAALKPDVILFGEQLPFAELQASHAETRRCDLMLVAGSSLSTEPAASLPRLASQYGARLIFVNLQPTWLDDLADVVIHADVAQILPAIADGLESDERSIQE